MHLSKLGSVPECCWILTHTPTVAPHVRRAAAQLLRPPPIVSRTSIARSGSSPLGGFLASPLTFEPRPHSPHQWHQGSISAFNPAFLLRQTLAAGSLSFLSPPSGLPGSQRMAAGAGLAHPNPWQGRPHVSDWPKRRHCCSSHLALLRPDGQITAVLVPFFVEGNMPLSRRALLLDLLPPHSCCASLLISRSLLPGCPTNHLSPACSRSCQLAW